MAACTVPNLLSNGTTADAVPVMFNFTSIAGCAAPSASPSFTGSIGINTPSGGGGGTITLDVKNASLSAVQRLWSTAAGAVLVLDRYANTGTGASQIAFSTAGASDFAVGTSVGSAATNAFSIYNYGTSSNPFTILKSNNYIGVGTVSPGYPLHVNGTAYAIGAAGALSDVRHKSDVVPLQNGTLEQVMQLRPVSFTWNEPKDAGMRGRQMGFIAQEVENVLPSAILTEDNAEKTKGLKYNELIAVLTKALQEQQTEIRSLKVANDNHIQAVADLGAKLGALERQVRIQTAKK